MQPYTSNERLSVLLLRMKIADSSDSPESPGPQGKSTGSTKRRERTREGDSEPHLRNKEQDVMQGAFPGRERVLGRRNLDLSRRERTAFISRGSHGTARRHGTYYVILPRQDVVEQDEHFRKEQYRDETLGARQVLHTCEFVSL